MQPPRVEIYGPLGLRALLRAQLTLSYVNLNGRYIVHELLWPGQRPTSSVRDLSEMPQSSLEVDCGLAGSIHGPRRTIPEMPLHDSEVAGRDIFMDDKSASWPAITAIKDFTITAAPILHRCPTLAYVFREPDTASPLPDWVYGKLDQNVHGLRAKGIKNPRSLVKTLVKLRESVDLPDGTVLMPPPLNVPGRKIVVCGDTQDATGGLPDDVGLTPLAQDATVLIHEATNAAIHPDLAVSNKKETLEEVEAKALSRGHSTPQGAGRFAGKIRAQNLILNHFSTRYPAPPVSWIEESRSGASHTKTKAMAKGGSKGSPYHRQLATMQSFETQATMAWHSAMPSDSYTDAAWRSREAFAAYDGFVFYVERQLPPTLKSAGGSKKGPPPVFARAPRPGSSSGGSADAMPSSDERPGANTDSSHQDKQHGSQSAPSDCESVASRVSVSQRPPASFMIDSHPSTNAFMRQQQEHIRSLLDEGQQRLQQQQKGSAAMPTTTEQKKKWKGPRPTESDFKDRPKRIKGIKGMHQIHLLEGLAELRQQRLEAERRNMVGGLAPADAASKTRTSDSVNLSDDTNVSAQSGNDSGPPRATQKARALCSSDEGKNGSDNYSDLGAPF